ncbi:MAG: biotin--[acetyl-CoA-carboxylase] ligase [Methylobacteriaceae bacterium]|nr:biotin--[acetyl-CoA-carboxylase] ligase [Methylobacteriaceae bacterium]
MAEAQGFSVVAFDAVASTNDLCLERARDGADRLWIVAQSQTGGRGRRGRGWSSPPGNLYASLLLVDPAPMTVAAQIGFVAALALHDAVAGLLPAPALAALKLKWPNDLLLAGAKLSGILVEATTLAAGRTAVVVGIGVNIVAGAAEAPYATTHLSRHMGASAGDPGALLFAALSDAMARRLAQWDRGAGFAATRADWLARAAGLGGAVRVETMGAPIVGVLRTMDASGRLVVDCADGHARLVEAGDVFLTA